MADFSKFRTAVSGFNRTDVVNYIESASMEHQKALRKLTDERDKLAAENAQLQTQLTGPADRSAASAGPADPGAGRQRRADRAGEHASAGGL